MKLFSVSGVRLYDAFRKREVNVVFRFSLIIGDIPGSNEVISMLSSTAKHPCRLCLESSEFFQLVPEFEDEKWLYRDVEAIKAVILASLNTLLKNIRGTIGDAKKKS